MSEHITSQANDRAAETAGGGASTMQLDHVPGDPSSPPVYGPFMPGTGPLLPGTPDLVSTPEEKRAAANAIEGHIQSGTKKAGEWAKGETSAAVKALAAKDGDGWTTSRALKKAHTTWGDQVQNLMNRLEAEKAALRGAHTALRGTDLSTEGQIRQCSPFDDY
ncbi:hypothetical protein [Streptomyces halstedii]|uniref:hypothetical protein n=2 Tax=Streptomyces halstedii TaxID=1944 RepID=UPI0036559A93